MTEGEETIRDEAQYLSTYKRVLEYFDATLIGLTATPALHTTEIFGKPVFTYSFTRAVEEGYLVNYNNPIRYITKLSQAGIDIPEGTTVQVLTNATGQKNTALLQDDMDFDVADFNRRVIAPEFNKVICRALVEDLNPLGDEKTMIFCVTDRHADQMVLFLNEMFKEKYGKDWNSDVVAKITGNSDQPDKLIESYKKSKFPNIAVTVDLLTTGIDVQKICNLVFMRKVRSRILFEQMLGRATRLCPEIGKTEFRIYDAVDIFATLQAVNTMQPIVVRPNISIDQLIRELTDADLMKKAKAMDVPCIDEVKRTQADIVLDEFIQKITRILGKAEKFKHHPDQVKLREALRKIKENFGVESNKLPQMLRAKGVDDLALWLKQNSAILEARLAEVRNSLGTLDLPIISDEQDELVERIVDTAHQQPQDYLEYFDNFVKTAVNNNAAIKAVVTRPSELTREQLRELENLLTSKGFTQSKLSQALSANESNQTYASQIISQIRRATLGEEISSVEERFQRGLNKILQQRDWSVDQQQWLQRLTRFIAQEIVVDKSMIQRQFARDGGVVRLNKLLDSDVEKLVNEINDGLWQAS
jgi:type I restriction enzyme, R subunit